MWLLPWEKLHPIILGPLLILLGTLGLFEVRDSSWFRFEAVFGILGGIGLFILGVRKIADETRHVNSRSLHIDAENRIAEASAPPDYVKYTEAQLRQVLTRIDRARFPERVAQIEARLQSIEMARATPEI